MVEKLNNKELAERFLSMIFSEDFSELFKTVLELTETYEANLNELEKRISRAKEFTNVANQDLKAARILYNSEIYSLAIYHLQQAVEKYVKAFVIAFFGLSNNEIKKYIDHDSPKAFIRLLDRYKKLLGSLSKNLQKITGTNTPIWTITSKDVSKLLNVVNKNKIQIAKFDSDEIMKLIAALTKVRSVLESKEMEQKIITLLIKLKRGLAEIEFNESDKPILEIVNNAIDKKLNNIGKTLKLTSTFLALYILSIITYPHATFTRYPGKTLSPGDYSESLGIVQCFEEISNLLKDVVNSFVSEITN